MRKLERILAQALCFVMVFNLIVIGGALDNDGLESKTTDETKSLYALNGNSDSSIASEEIATGEELSDDEPSINVGISDTSESYDVEKEEMSTEFSETYLSESSEAKKDDAIDEETDIVAVASESEVIAYEEEMTVATKSNITKLFGGKNLSKEEYAKLDTIEQITYIVEDGAKLDGDTIILQKDISLYDTVRFTENMNLDLAGFTITGTNDNYVLYIENNFTLMNSTENIGTIESVNPKYVAIVAKNAKLVLDAGNIVGSNATENAECADGGDAILVYNSDVIIDGAIVKGGNGADKSNEKGGDAGNAVVICESTNNNYIKINSGKVQGGNGGRGRGNDTPDTGAAISYNGLFQGGKGTGKGRNGKKGGGNGGIAVDIRTKKFKLNNLAFEEGTLFAGSAGLSVKKENNTIKLYGSAPDAVNQSYYSLYDLDGKNYLTSLKNQDDEGLCAIFALCAQAETYMMKRFPDYIRNVFDKIISKNKATMPSRDEEFNLSEFYFAMSMHKPATDAFGNAGHSNALKEADRRRWADDIGSTSQNQLSLASTWRGFVVEDNTISDELPRTSSVENYINNAVSQTVTDSYADKTVVHANNMLLYSAIDYVDEDNNFDLNSYILDMKKNIVKYDGVFVGYYLSGYSSINYSSHGTDYGTCQIFYATKTMNSYRGHGMYCIGWDDDFKYNFYSNGAMRSGKGVFILKNSWQAFALIPYDYNWVNWYNTTDYATFPEMTTEFSPAEFMPAFSKYENNYFYDTGVGGVSKNSRITMTKDVNSDVKVDLKVAYKKVLNVFKIRNDKEKAIAVSFYANEIGRNYEAALYRVPNDTDEVEIANAINDESKKLASKTWVTHHGINVIDLDETVDLMKGNYVAVVITADENNMGRLWIDGEGIEEIDKGDFYHTTDVKEKSFLASPTVNIEKFYKNNIEVTGTEFDTMCNTYRDSIINSLKCYKLTDVNLRLKLFTNNYVMIDAGDDGNVDGNKIVYFYPHLRATMSTLPNPTVINDDKKFVCYTTNADGTGDIYDRNSVYHLSIGKYLKLYAQYENKSSVEATTVNTEATTPSSTGEMIEPASIAPTETIGIEVNGGGTSRKYSGGGIGGGGTLPSNITSIENQNNFTKTKVNTNNLSVKPLSNASVKWIADNITGKWKLNAVNIIGVSFFARDGFYQITRNINNNQQVTDTYYFDANGDMLTGWMNTEDNKWYFFDSKKGSDEGKMALGWKMIENDWYYFTRNGSMFVSGITPDGYKVDSDGRLME